MPCRLWFTNTKNYERKRQAQKRLAKNCEIKRNPQPQLLTSGNSDSILPFGWNNMSNDSSDEIRLCKVSSQSGTSFEPVKISHSIIINSNMTWNVFVHGSEFLVVRTHRCPNSRINCLLNHYNP